MKKKQLLFLLSCVFMYTVSFGQNTIYVDSSNVTGTHDGTSWATAFDSLQNAINAASPGDSVFVAKGTYQSVSGNNFYVGNNIEIYGGFSATDNTFALRDWNANPTILEGNNADVIDLFNATTPIVLDGFSITNGKNNSNNSGAGISTLNVVAKLANLKIYGDTSTASNSTGGGLYCRDYSESYQITLSNVSIYNNACPNSLEGDGIYLDDGLITISNSKIYNNEYNGIACNSGIMTINNQSAIYNNSYGGVYNNNNNGTVNINNQVAIYNNGGGIDNSGTMNISNQVDIYNNISNYDGGGIYNDGTMTISNKVAIHDNYATNSSGGGIAEEGGSMVLKNVAIYNDTASYEGGGFCNFGSNYSATFTNVIFYNNSVDPFNGYDGGAIASDDGKNTFTNCTFYNNTSPYGGAIDSYDGSTLTINNSVFWANNDNGGGYNDIADEDGTASIAYNYTQTDFSSYSAKNIMGTMNPFEDTTNIKGADATIMTADDGLELTCGSPTINGGSNALLPSGDSTDITGAARIKLGKVDMGAYENMKYTQSIQTVTACGNYIWQGINRTASGTYYGDTLTNSAGCDSLTLLNLTINPYATKALVQVQNSLVAIANNGVNYQWIFCDSSAISGETGESFTATQNGSYAVILTTPLGCVDTSACQDLTTTGVQNYSSTNNVSIYPMPNNGNFVITFTGLGYQSIAIYDETGKKVSSQLLDEKSLNTSLPINLSMYPSGIYFAEILTSHGLENKKILIQK